MAPRLTEVRRLTPTVLKDGLETKATPRGRPVLPELHTKVKVRTSVILKPNLATQQEGRERKSAARQRHAGGATLPTHIARGEALSLLEKRAVTSRSAEEYLRYQRLFEAFCEESGLSGQYRVWTDLELLDYFDNLYLQGYAPSAGHKTVAALQHFEPRFRKNGKWAFTRALRALAGWRRLAPANSRLPLPHLAAEGIMLSLRYNGKYQLALYVATIFSTYLRPSEGLALRGRDIVPPVRGSGSQRHDTMVCVRSSSDGIPDKTGDFDNSIPLDGNYWKFLPAILERRAKEVGGTRAGCSRSPSSALGRNSRRPRLRSVWATSASTSAVAAERPTTSTRGSALMRL